MSKKNPFVLIGLILSLNSCCFYGDCNSEEPFEPYQSPYTAVLMPRAEFEDAVVVLEPRPIETSGKIYVKDNLLFINEKYAGFHVYDNSNPSNPTPIHFIQAPGATDIAIRDNIFYINQAVDLIAVAITPNAESITVTKRIENTFPELQAPDGSYAFDKADDEIVINWELTSN